MPLLRVTRGVNGEIEESEDIQLPPEDDIIPDSVSSSEEENEVSSEKEEAIVAPGPPVGLPPPPQFAPPPAVMPMAPPSLDAGATEEEKTPSVEELTSKFYKVLWEYKNDEEDPDTLTLRVGDILIVLETRADGWWKGQSGDLIGLFPVAYCESISEDEVKAFILASSSQASKRDKNPSGAASGAGSRAELEREMKELQAEQASLSAQSKELKDEVSLLKEDARKLRKKTREELLELFDSLPASLYHIPMFDNIQNNIIRAAVQIAGILDIESDHKELLPDAILNCSTFVDEGPKTLASEPKLKAEVDKVVTKVLALQKFLLDEHANSNLELPRNVMNSLELLALRIHAFTQGEIDMTQATTTELTSPQSPKPSPKTETEGNNEDNKTSSPQDTPTTKKRSKSTKTSTPASSDESSAPIATNDNEETPTSPREKKRRKKDRATVVLSADEDDTQNGKEPKEKEKKKKRRDKDGMTSPRKSRMVEDPESAVDGADETPVSPRSKDKKSRRKKVEEEAAAAAVSVAVAVMEEDE